MAAMWQHMTEECILSRALQVVTWESVVFAAKELCERDLPHLP